MIINKNSICLKGITFEDFVNYKVPSLFLVTSYCDWKCCVEAGCDISICQNSDLALAESKEYSIISLYNAYINNDITKAIVIGGLEPILQFSEVLAFIDYFRSKDCHDPIIIYTGYNKKELKNQLAILKEYDNIIIKFGRFVPNQEYHFDKVLGINLISDNQYAERIS